MRSVRYQGFVVAVEHPAVWVDKGEQIIRDLIDVMIHREISVACLEHLIDNRGRLIAGRYRSGDRGCLMYVLTEPLGKRQVRSKRDLVRFFGVARGRPGFFGHVAAKDSAEYQPAKWLVRLVDGQICQHVRRRYGRACEFFDYYLVIEVARQILAQRMAMERPARSLMSSKA